LALVLLCFSSGASAQVPDVEKALMPGPVIEGHAKYEQECEKCHKRFDKAAQSQLCADCHKDVAGDIRGKTKLHGRLEDKTCKTCHPDHKGRGANVAFVDKDKFDHDRTNFKLRGGHKETRNKCADCHPAKKKYRDTSADCFSCHRKDDEGNKGHKGSLGKKCEQCHNDVKWTEAKFDHNKTKFKLDGEHSSVACKECHHEGKYKDTPKECYACHKKDDNDDGHHGSFGTKCEKCHTTDSWREPSFDHDRDTKYRLKGKHAQTACNDCHKGALFKEKAPTKCLACHRKADDDKGHKGSLGEKCESCHNEQSWKTSTFDHDKDTKYPLEGKHKTAKCDTCHKSGLKLVPGTKKIEKLPNRCVECHRKEDNDKGHKGKFGEKCETCHNAKEWKKTIFDHDLDTKYLLKGKHRETKCSVCHTVQLYVEKTATDCNSCHRKDDKEKGHKGQLGEKCEECHTEANWKVEKYDHNKSRYPLTGKHVVVECKKCHLTPAFRDAKRVCAACHDKDDVHKRRLGPRCEQCHNTRTWKSWDFDHNKTNYPLAGKHAKVPCEQCHKVPVQGKVALASACVECHSAEDVHHGGFGTQCERCHGLESWKAIRK
jgi:hypothetical protein